MTIREIMGKYGVQTADTEIYLCEGNMMRIHTDRIESVEGLDLDHEYSLPDEINYDVMDQDEYGATVLANSSLDADFAEWFDDKEAEVLVIWIREGREVFPENRIKAIRKMTGLSQTKFGEKYGIPMRTIQNWENNVNEAPEYLVDLLEQEVWENREEAFIRWAFVDATADQFDCTFTESKMDALRTAELQWEKMSEYDRKRRTAFYVGLVNADTYDTCAISRKWV